MKLTTDLFPYCDVDFFWELFPLSIAIFNAEPRRRRIYAAVGAEKSNRRVENYNKNEVINFL